MGLSRSGGGHPAAGAGGEGEAALRRAYPWLLVLAGALVALLLLLPFRAQDFVRSDGVTVRLLAPDRLSHQSDAYDYLQLGRRLYQGHGFTSLFTYVPFLPESVPAAGERIDAFPLFWRQPGFPLLVAAAFAVAGGPRPDALLALEALVVMLLPLAAWLLARRVLSPGWAALAAFWTLAAPVALAPRAPVVATTFYAAYVAVLFAALIAARRPASWVGAGVLLGVGALFRLETWILAPGLLTAFALARDRRRGLGVAVVVAAAVLTVLPWHLRLASLTGKPFYNASSLLFHDTAAFPDWQASRTLAVRDLAPWTFVIEHPGEVVGKTALNLARYLRDMVFLPSLLLAPFLFLGLVRPPADRRGRALAVGTLVAGAALILALAPMEYSPRFLAPLVPAFAVVAALFLVRLPRYRRVLAGAAVAVGLVGLGSALADRPADGNAGAAARDLDRLMTLPQAAPLAGGAVALSDAPTLYAWIWDRPAVGAPLAGDLPRITALVGSPVGVFTCSLAPGPFVEEDLGAEYAAAGWRRFGAGCPFLMLPPAGKEGR